MNDEQNQMKLNTNFGSVPKVM